MRPGELRNARWEEVDFDTAEWRIPAERMKARQPHIVLLSEQALAILKELHPLTGRGEYVFPSARSPRRPMSDNAVLAAMRRMGIEKDEMCGHGFRAIPMSNVIDFVKAFELKQLRSAAKAMLGLPLQLVVDTF